MLSPDADVSTSQRFTVLSPDADASCRPSPEKATDLTVLLCRGDPHLGCPSAPSKWVQSSHCTGDANRRVRTADRVAERRHLRRYAILDGPSTESLGSRGRVHTPITPLTPKPNQPRPLMPNSAGVHVVEATNPLYVPTVVYEFLGPNCRHHGDAKVHLRQLGPRAERVQEDGNFQLHELSVGGRRLAHPVTLIVARV